MGKKELKAILAKNNINATDEEIQKMINLISLNGMCVNEERFEWKIEADLKLPSVDAPG